MFVFLFLEEHRNHHVFGKSTYSFVRLYYCDYFSALSCNLYDETRLLEWIELLLLPLPVVYSLNSVFKCKSVAELIYLYSCVFWKWNCGRCVRSMYKSAVLRQQWTSKRQQAKYNTREKKMRQTASVAAFRQNFAIFLIFFLFFRSPQILFLAANNWEIKTVHIHD